MGVSHKNNAAALALDGGRYISLGMRADLFELVEKMYEEHYEGLYRYLLLSGCQPADADDYLQEGFFRLLRFLQQGNKVEKPKSWLLVVLHNIKTDEARREQRQAVLSETDFEDQVAKVFGTARDAEAESLEQERQEELRRAVSRLTARQYRYLLLRAAGMKLREIAELHGVTVQTVAEACSRATDRLGRLSRE